MSYIWYKDSREIIRSNDIERNEIFSGDITQEYYDGYIGNQTNYGGGLFLLSSQITSLGKLERVEGYLCLNSVNLTSLGNLDYVSDDIYCDRGTSTHKLLIHSKFRDQVKI